LWWNDKKENCCDDDDHAHQASHREDHEFPLKAELIENVLIAKIESHDLTLGEETISCWTFTTQGLVGVGQAEIVVTIQRESNETPHQFPEDPLHWFVQVHKLASQGMTVGVGGRTALRSGHFLAPLMVGIIYQKAQPLEGIELPEGALCMVPVTSSEFEATEEFGQLRMLSLLGQRYHYYPFPPWFDRQRESVVDSEMLSEMHASMCAQMPRVMVKGLRVMQHGRELNAILTNGATLGFQQLFAQMPPGANCIRLTLDLDDRADACLTWQAPGAGYPQAIAKLQGESGIRSTSQVWVAGTFLSIVGGAEISTYRVYEDGFALMLTEHDWNSVIVALKTGDHLNINMAEGTTFKLSWDEAKV